MHSNLHSERLTLLTLFTRQNHCTEGFEDADKNREGEHAGRLECLDEQVVR